MKKVNLNYGFMLFLMVICLVTFTLEMINGRFWLGDFKVYYSAAQNFFSGEQVYLLDFYKGSGFYKYSPVVLFFFLPLTILSYKIASIIHFFILGFAFWYSFTLILKILKKYFFRWEIKHEGWLLCLSFICILIYFTREMHLGNINIIMLLLCCQALQCYLDKKFFLGSLFFGLVVLTKPFYLLLLLPLFWRKNWRGLIWFIFVLACGGIIPFLYLGFTDGLTLYSGWFSTILVHSQDFPGMGSIDYLIRHNIYTALPGFAEYIIMLMMCGFSTGFVLTNIKKERNVKNGEVLAERNFIFEWFLILSLLPVLFKTDWVQLLLSAPLITFMIFYISCTKKYWLIPIMVFLLFFFGANSDDLLGKELSGKFLTMGFMGLSNFILVIISLFMFLDFRKGKNLIYPKRSPDKPHSKMPI